MRIAAALLLLIGTVSAASSQSAGSTPVMTCAEAKGMVQSQGAVVLHTGPTTYDRYVSSSGFCFHGQTIKPEWVRTADTSQCFVGYRCAQPDLDNGR